ncbi:hypothetical protein Nmel_016702 [Mimus melanotis]
MLATGDQRSKILQNTRTGRTAPGQGILGATGNNKNISTEHSM